MFSRMSKMKIYVIYMNVRNSTVFCMHSRNLKNFMHAGQTLAETLLNSKYQVKNSIYLPTCIDICYQSYKFFSLGFLPQKLIKRNIKLLPDGIGMRPGLLSFVPRTCVLPGASRQLHYVILVLQSVCAAWKYDDSIDC